MSRRLVFTYMPPAGCGKECRFLDHQQPILPEHNYNFCMPPPSYLCIWWVKLTDGAVTAGILHLWDEVCTHWQVFVRKVNIK